VMVYMAGLPGVWCTDLLPFCNRMFDALDSNQDGYLSRRGTCVVSRDVPLLLR